MRFIHRNIYLFKRASLYICAELARIRTIVSLQGRA